MRFRVLDDRPRAAAWNMAVDEALYLTAVEGTGTATLRLYGFRPHAVSFGYRQRIDDVVDAAACRDLGVDLVRRPTGGRALLHQHELTYSVTAPASGPFERLSVRGVYRLVTGAIRSALDRLGAPLDPASPWEREGGAGHGPGTSLTSLTSLTAPCLAVPGRHEISSGGRKLVASALRRSSKGFLQHGAILTRVDTGLWSRIARGPSATALLAVGLFDLVPDLDEAGLSAALRTSFERTLGISSLPSELLPRERGLLPALLEKYRSASWNESRAAVAAVRDPPVRLVDNSEAVW